MYVRTHSLSTEYSCKHKHRGAHIKKGIWNVVTTPATTPAYYASFKFAPHRILYKDQRQGQDCNQIRKKEVY